MATGKRYYWMKLKESFMTSDTIDYFMEQPDGANYVVLYQLLCLKTINTGGRLSRQIGEIIIPYDVSKIQRDCKWFSADTVRVALKLYQAVGLIYEDVDGTLVLTDHKNLVGSETDYALQKKNQRESPPQLPPAGVDNVHSDVHQNVHTDIEIDIRDRDKRLEIDKDIDIKAPKARPRTKFQKPTLEEIQNYCRERGNSVDAVRFFDYYTANGWRVGKNPMKDWTAAVRTWEKNDNVRNSGINKGTAQESPKRWNIEYTVDGRTE